MSYKEDLQIVINFSRNALLQEQRRAQELLANLQSEISSVEGALNNLEKRLQSRGSKESPETSLEGLDISPEA